MFCSFYRCFPALVLTSLNEVFKSNDIKVDVVLYLCQVETKLTKQYHFASAVIAPLHLNLQIVALFVQLAFLGQAFTMMLVYVWSRRNPYIRMNFFGLMNFQVRD